MHLNINAVTPSRALEALRDCYETRLSVFLHGAPGVGKSQIARQFAESVGGGLWDVRLPTLDVPDIRGLYYPDPATGTTVQLVPEFYPRGDARGVLLLDELTAAEPRVQAGAYELILDRRMGRYEVPKNVIVMAAGNSAADRAIAYEMGTAVADRLVHLLVQPETKDWLSWAARSHVHPDVITFIRVRPEYLTGSETGEPGHDLVSPSPRSWERVSKVLAACRSRERAAPLVEGIVGRAAAAMFSIVLDEIEGVPPVEDLLAESPERAARRVPAKLGALYGLASSVPAYATSLDDLERASRLFEALAGVDDDLPRAEVRSVAMERLLERAEAIGCFDAFGASAAYAAYEEQAGVLTLA